MSLTLTMYSLSGTIGLPPKVISSLWGDNLSAGSIEIKYVKLPKISYVKLEPTFNTFFKVEQVKMVLEENLKFHSTLTVGDVITVWFRGQAHPLKVVEMKPFDKGILLDTDVEVDLDNSLENKTTSEKFSSDKINEVSKVKVEADQTSSNSYHKLSSSTPSSSSTISNINTPANACISTQNVLQNLPQNLPNEPEPDADDIVSVRVRTPTGITINRRFYRKEPFSHLFEFASVEMRVEKKVLQLSTRFPNRVFTLNQIEATTSFLEMGITLPQELFLASVIM
jgi:Ubiquitin fusion degradation protein UFD1/UBX domain